MKRIGILVVLCMVFLSGCAKPDPINVDYTQIYDVGLESVQVISEMASSEEYISLLTASPDLMAVAKEIGEGDYTKPKAVYAIAIEDETLDLLSENGGFENMSDGLLTSIRRKTLSSIIPTINSTAGVNALAAASILTTGRSFVNPLMMGETGEIVVFTYENGYPIAVTFTGNADFAISASAMPVMVEGFDTIDGIKEKLGYVEAEVVEITQ